MSAGLLGTEHVLLGLLRQENGVAAAALQAGRSPSPGHASGLRGGGIKFQTLSAEINRVIGHGTAANIAPAVTMAITSKIVPGSLKPASTGGTTTQSIVHTKGPAVWHVRSPRPWQFFVDHIGDLGNAILVQPAAEPADYCGPDH